MRKELIIFWISTGIIASTFDRMHFFTPAAMEIIDDILWLIHGTFLGIILAIEKYGEQK